MVSLRQIYGDFLWLPSKFVLAFQGSFVGRKKGPKCRREQVLAPLAMNVSYLLIAASKPTEQNVPNAVYRGSPKNVGSRVTAIITSTSDMRATVAYLLSDH